jgi:hypothetical protein
MIENKKGTLDAIKKRPINIYEQAPLHYANIMQLLLIVGG